MQMSGVLSERIELEYLISRSIGIMLYLSYTCFYFAMLSAGL